MAWTSSATPGELVCLDDRDAGAELTQALEETLDSRQSQSWSKVVAALLLALLAAAMPAGPEMAAVVILSSGLMAMLSLRNPINAPPAHAVFGFHGAVAPNQPLRRRPKPPRASRCSTQKTRRRRPLARSRLPR